MSEQPPANDSDPSFEDVIGRKEQRKLIAQRSGHRTIWFGLGMFGLIGWSVAIPTILGVALGLWIDHRWESRYSWTLMLMIAGVALGCLNAWRWVHREGGLDERTNTR